MLQYLLLLHFFAKVNVSTDIFVTVIVVTVIIVTVIFSTVFVFTLLLLQLLLLQLLLLQLLLFQLFGVTLTWLTGAALVSLMMLLLALVPTIALAELGFRGQISLRLFSLVSANYAGIMATAAGIWVINLIIPALAGSLLVLGIRIFTKKKR